MNKKYLGFFPNKSIWVGDKPLISGDNLDFLPKLFSEIVYSYSSQYFDLLACRDGLFLLSLKFQNSNVGLYLDYMNAFYVVLESSISQTKFQKYFTIEEITIKDYVYHEYGESGLMNYKLDNLNTKTNYLYNARFLKGYIPLDFSKIDIKNNKFWQDLLVCSIKNDPRISEREDRIISINELDIAVKLFDRICLSWEHVNLLSKLSRVVQEINLGNYAYAISYSWLIIEIYLDKLYYTNRLGVSPKGDKIVTSLEMINDLRDRKILPRELAGEIHLLRKTRNLIIHDQLNKAGFDQSILAVEIIREFIRKDIAVDIKLLF